MTPGRVLAIVGLTLVLMGLALWTALGAQEARVDAEDPTRSGD